MFLEVAHHLLKREGQIGMLVPSGIYTDKGSQELRKLFLDNCRWEWLFGFINWQRVFDIDSRFKFVVLLLQKGKSTQQLRVAFNQVDLSELEQPDAVMIDFPRTQVEQFSPKSLVIVEPQSQRDIDILEKLYTNTVLLDEQSEQGWQIQYASEFHMTNDSILFPPLPKWEAKGYRPDGYGHWVGPEGDIALPLYEGRMIGPFDPSEKGWVSGKGRGAVWSPISFENKALKPQYLISLRDSVERIGDLGICKISFMSIGSATNSRSMYASVIDNLPCGHSISTLRISSDSLLDTLTLGAILNSFAYDYALRCRLGGLNLSYFVLAETPLPPIARLRQTCVAELAARLNLVMPSFAQQWLDICASHPYLGKQHWRKLWAITQPERLRLRCILDAIIAELYGLGYEDLAWILRDDPTNPKGFWRVDKEKPKELRQTTLALAAFKRLKEVGLEAFCQEDWQFLPEIGAQLGPRFTAWQEQVTVAESWAECEEHAQRMKEIPMLLLEKNREMGRDGKNGQGKTTQRAQLDLWNT